MRGIRTENIANVKHPNARQGPPSPSVWMYGAVSWSCSLDHWLNGDVRGGRCAVQLHTHRERQGDPGTESEDQIFVTLSDQQVLSALLGWRVRRLHLRLHIGCPGGAFS